MRAPYAMVATDRSSAPHGWLWFVLRGVQAETMTQDSGREPDCLHNADLEPIAVAIGEAWATELVHSLRSEDRDAVGAWPGTLGEARMRVRLTLRRRLDVVVIEELARIAYVAARRGWQALSVPDPES